MVYKPNELHLISVMNKLHPALKDSLTPDDLDNLRNDEADEKVEYRAKKLLKEGKKTEKKRLGHLMGTPTRLEIDNLLKDVASSKRVEGIDTRLSALANTVFVIFRTMSNKGLISMRELTETKEEILDSLKELTPEEKMDFFAKMDEDFTEMLSQQIYNPDTKPTESPDETEIQVETPAETAEPETSQEDHTDDSPSESSSDKAHQ